MRAPYDGLKRRLTDATGTAAIEFGVFLPVLAILVMGVAELGFGLYQAVGAYSAVEAGMLYAAKKGFDSSGISSAVLKGASLPGITASPPVSTRNRCR